MALARRLALPAALLVAAPAAAEDIFDRFPGDYGMPSLGTPLCQDNAHRITFSADRSRAIFDWRRPFENYRGEAMQTGGYTVLGHDETSITLALDDESRLTAEGAPVVWILRHIETPEGYCWGRTDWPAGRCIALHLRCPAPPSVS